MRVNINRKLREKKKIVWQRHHITYKPEVCVWIRRSMHYYITLLNRFSGMTYNEKRALRYIIKNKPTLKAKRGKK